MQNDILETAKIAITNQLFPGCVVGVVLRDGSRLVVPCGHQTYEKDSPLVTEQTIYDCASITKSIPTSSLALQLIDDGRLSLEDRITKYIPEFQTNYAGEVKIKHLLTQTLDYGFRLSDFKNKTPDEILNVIFSYPLKSMPGTTFFYTNATSILLGLVVERIYGRSLDRLAENQFFKPLQMSRTSFNPLNKYSKEDIAPSEIQEWRQGEIRGEVHDESAYALLPKMRVGSAGIFSTAPDLLIFMRMFLNGGVDRGRRYLSDKIIAQAESNQLADIDYSAGLGWELFQPRYMGRYCDEHTIGKTGFTGCVVMANRTKGIALVILSNYTYPKRKDGSEQINKFRCDIADIVFSGEL